MVEENPVPQQTEYKMLLKRKTDLSVKFLRKVCLGTMLKIVNFF